MPTSRFSVSVSRSAMAAPIWARKDGANDAVLAVDIGVDIFGRVGAVRRLVLVFQRRLPFIGSGQRSRLARKVRKHQTKCACWRSATFRTPFGQVISLPNRSALPKSLLLVIDLLPESQHRAHHTSSHGALSIKPAAPPPAAGFFLPFYSLHRHPSSGGGISLGPRATARCCEQPQILASGDAEKCPKSGVMVDGTGIMPPTPLFRRKRFATRRKPVVTGFYHVRSWRNW